jgi:hypothetical protein
MLLERALGKDVRLAQSLAKPPALGSRRSAGWLSPEAGGRRVRDAKTAGSTCAGDSVVVLDGPAGHHELERAGDERGIFTADRSQL